MARDKTVRGLSWIYPAEEDSASIFKRPLGSQNNRVASIHACCGKADIPAVFDEHNFSKG
jgi:hypothetical protein